MITAIYIMLFTLALIIAYDETMEIEVLHVDYGKSSESMEEVSYIFLIDDEDEDEDDTIINDDGPEDNPWILLAA